MLALPASLPAQQGGLDGRLRHVRASGDTVAATGTVVLHRLTTTAQGPVDTARTDAGGSFRFRFRVDPLALYLVSSRHHGVEYFGRPLSFASGVLRDSLVLVVHDTAATATVAVGDRYLVVGRPDSGGRRPVIDLLRLHNPGPTTRVAPDSTAPTWSMPLPAGAGDFALGEGEFSARAVERRGDSVAVLMPLQPGDRQLVLTYHVPAGRRLAWAGPPVSDSLVVLLEERDARVRTAGFAVADSQVIDGRTYRRWPGRGGDGALEVAFPAPPGTGATLPLLGLLAVALGIGAALALRSRRSGGDSAVAVASSPEDVSRLVEAIARLDADYAGREGEVPPDTWAGYVARRAELRLRLDAALAARGTGG